MPLNLMPEINRFVTDDLGWDAATRQEMLDAFCAGGAYTGTIPDPVTGEEIPATQSEFVNWKLKRYVVKLCDSGSLRVAYDAAEATIVPWDMEE